MNLNKKSLCALLMVGIIAIFVSGCSNTKMGVVDTERIMKESPQIQTITKAQTEQYTQKQKDLTEKLQNDKANMSDADYQKSVNAAKAELSGMESQFNSELKTTIDKAMADVSKEKDLSAVVMKDLVQTNQMGQPTKEQFVIQGGIDITDDLIQKLQ
ncbi:outer membrane protein [Propionispira arboris]|uniref:Outer membrane protein n=1 Tax=Propionispira arboris TaxID=84035 RepID=A0A1H6U2E2_9FIRM|nr:OmpH family outer membrane protein [Propionispira arboris]SEI82580.1 outer membrane protein [Propionispira arboris]